MTDYKAQLNELDKNQVHYTWEELFLGARSIARKVIEENDGLREGIWDMAKTMDTRRDRVMVATLLGENNV
jgi:hypothetical protein